MAPSPSCFVCFRAIPSSVNAEDDFGSGNLKTKDPLKSLLQIFNWSFSSFTRDLTEDVSYEDIKANCGFCATCEDLLTTDSYLRRRLKEIKETLVQKAIRKSEDRRLKLAQLQRSSTGSSVPEPETVALKLGLRFAECKNKP